MKITSLITVSLALALAFSACKNEAPGQDETPQETATQTEAPTVIAVDWNALEALIPAAAAGLPRTNQAEDRSGLGDLGFSHSLGIYEKDGRRVEVQILDSGAKKLILSTVAPWYQLRNINEQSDFASEKTIEIQGYPAMERTDTKDNVTEVSAVVKDRFIVMIVGHNVSVKELRQIMDGLDLKKLENLG